MANKVIKDSIRNSKSLVRCSFTAELNFPRFLLLTDDWGCFEIDLETIRGYLYPKRLKEVTLSKIASWLKEYEDNGMLFCWSNGKREFGFFVNYDAHSGEYLSRKHKRKTSEPPKEELIKYQELMNKKFKRLQKTSKDFKSSPIPNPNPNPNPIKEKSTYAEFIKLTPEEHQKLLDKYGEYHTKLMIEKLANYIGSTGKRYKSHYRTILNWVADEILEKYPIGAGQREFKDDRSPDDKLVDQKEIKEFNKQIKKIGRKVK